MGFFSIYHLFLCPYNLKYWNRKLSVKLFRNQFIAIDVMATLLIGFLLSFAWLNPIQAQRLPQSFADTVEKLLPSVVNIQTLATVSPSSNSQFDFQIPEGLPFSEKFWEELRRRQSEPRQAQAQGSGFVIDTKKGLIVTNNHVVENASEITVLFQDNRKLKATLVGRDVQTDLAVLKIEPFRDLKAVPWANSDKARVGDWVLAIGNPLGLGGTVTSGIISARGRNINSGPYDDYIQTDASINRGNSGGPLFNIQGEVVGINTAIYSSERGGSIGIAFSIPSNLARNVISQLIAYGETKRGWLGVYIQEVTPEIAQSLGLKEAIGALVSSVQEASPAKKAGIEPQDVIVKFNGIKVLKEQALPRIVAETTPDKTVSVEVIRQGKTLSLKVKVGKLPNSTTKAKVPESKPENEEPAISNTIDELGVKVTRFNATFRKKYNITADIPDGLLITDVITASTPSQSLTLRPSMIITKIDQSNVTSVKEARAALKKAKKNNKESVLLRIYLPNGITSFVGVKLK